MKHIAFAVLAALLWCSQAQAQEYSRTRSTPKVGLSGGGTLVAPLRLKDDVPVIYGDSDDVSCYWASAAPLVGAFVCDMPDDSGIAIGNTAAVSLAQDAVCIGNLASATGQDAVAIGRSANATDSCTAIRADCSGDSSVAIGASSAVTTATAADCVAVGATASCAGVRSVALGYGAQNQDSEKSVCIGYACLNPSTYDFLIAIGYSAAARDTNSIAIGYNPDTAAGANDAIAIGTSADVNANAAYGLAIGNASDVAASATYGIALGASANVDHAGAVCIGRGATSTAANQMQLGSASYPLDIYGYGTAAIGANASFTDFPNARMIVSQGDTGTDPFGGLWRSGIVGEAFSDSVQSAVGVIGLGLGDDTRSGIGGFFRGKPSNTADTGVSKGLVAFASTPHAGGLNIALEISANNGAENRALWHRAGDFDSTTSFDWDLVDDEPSALSLDAPGKAGVCEIDTTDSAEGVKMSGYLTVAGTVTSHGGGTKGATTITGTKSDSVTFANDASKTTTVEIFEGGVFLTHVTGRVTTALAGCTSVDVGDGVDVDLFVAGLAVAQNTTFDGDDVTASFSNPIISSTCAGGVCEITVTANGGNCTSGVVALTSHYFDATAATSN